jgi:predicted transglutaminase-like cysteine proteinase
MHVCAWCERKLGIRPATVRGVPSTNYGMCPDCLAERLVALMAAAPWPAYKLSITKLKAARRLAKAVYPVIAS